MSSRWFLVSGALLLLFTVGCGKPETGSAAPVDAKTVVKSFGFEAGTWKGDSRTDSVNLDGQALVIAANFNRWSLYSPALDVSARQIAVGAKIPSCKSIEIYWMADGDKGFAEDRHVTIDVAPGQTEFQGFFLPSKEPIHLKRLRFTFSNLERAAELDYVRLMS